MTARILVTCYCLWKGWRTPERIGLPCPHCGRIPQAVAR
jgi:hypothetical protein